MWPSQPITSRPLVSRHRKCLRGKHKQWTVMVKIYALHKFCFFRNNRQHHPVSAFLSSCCLLFVSLIPISPSLFFLACILRPYLVLVYFPVFISLVYLIVSRLSCAWWFSFSPLFLPFPYIFLTLIYFLYPLFFSLLFSLLCFAHFYFSSPSSPVLFCLWLSLCWPFFFCPVHAGQIPVISFCLHLRDLNLQMTNHSSTMYFFISIKMLR